MTVSGLATARSTVRVLTLAGEVVHQAEATGGSFTWDGRDDRTRDLVASGVYLVAAVGTAQVMNPAESVVMGGGALATTAYIRLFLLLGSVVGLALAVAGLAGGSRRDAPAVTLVVLGTAGLTMGLVDPNGA